MGQSLVKIYLHIIFSTKHRVHLINEPFENELYKYLGSICNSMESPVIKVGGHKNHVHILCMLSRKIALMDIIKEVKIRSSKWIKSKGSNFSNFYWQEGYGVFSVSPSKVDSVIKYIEQQKEHHQKLSFEDEYLRFLKEHKIEFDERYVWD